MVAAGAALLVPDDRIGHELSEAVTSIIHDRDKLEQMSRKARELARPDAAAVIAETIHKTGLEKQ